MTLRHSSLFCSLALMIPLYIDAMQATRPLERSHSAEDLSTPPPFIAPDISALRTIATNRTTTHNILAPQQSEPLIATQPITPTAALQSNEILDHITETLPSAPLLSELEPPSYEELMPPVIGISAQTALIQSLALAHAEVGTQTDICEEAQPSQMSSRLQAIASSSTATQQTLSPFDESDEEYKKFLTTAREKHLEEKFLALLNATHRGDHKIAEEVLNSPQCPEVGTLPLRAAIQGGSLETVKAIIPFFTLDDAQAILVEPIHYGQVDIFAFISNYWNFTYVNNSFLKKALASDTIKETFLDLMVSRGLKVDEMIISGRYPDNSNGNRESNSCSAKESLEELSPLYAAVRLNNSNAVRYFLKKNPSPFTVKFLVNKGLYSNAENSYTDLYNFYDLFLAKAKTPSIKKMLMDRERLDREKLNKTRLELERLKQEALKREKLEKRKKNGCGCTIQ